MASDTVMGGVGRGGTSSLLGGPWIRRSGIHRKARFRSRLRSRETRPPVPKNLRREKEETPGFLLQERGAAGEPPGYLRPVPVIWTMTFGLSPGRTMTILTWST